MFLLLFLHESHACVGATQYCSAINSALLLVDKRRNKSHSTAAQDTVLNVKLCLF